MEKLRRQWQLESALKSAEDNIVQKHKFPYRYISGVALTCSNNFAKTKGLKFKTPIPLLADHDWTLPLGKITKLSVRGEDLHFDATIANSGCLAQAEQIWADLILQEDFGVSVGWAAGGLKNSDGVLVAGELEEVSLVAHPRDPNTRVLKCWERNGVLVLNGPNELLWWKRA